MRATFSLLFVASALVLAPAALEAQIFKYEKPDGTVAYTDNLSDLPKERRIYYNRLLAEQKKKNEKAERAAKEHDAELRAAQAERERLARRREAEADYRRRMQALDATIESLKARNEARERAKKAWQERMRQAEKALADKLAAFRKTKRDWQELAIRADFSLFPGQVQKKQELREEMEKLEREVDALVHRINVVIPEEARKAGVPPGWLRL